MNKMYVCIPDLLRLASTRAWANGSRTGVDGGSVSTGSSLGSGGGSNKVMSESCGSEVEGSSGLIIN